MAGSGDADEVPWPGFVDILSTVLIVFVFFMMIVSMIVFYMGTNYVKAAQQAVAEAKKADSTISLLEKQRSQVSEEIEGMTKLLQNIKALSMPSSKQTVTVEQGVLRVVFEDLGSVPTESNKAVLAEQFKRFSKTCRGVLSITASVAERINMYGWGREIQLQRTLVLRNFALEAGFPADKIKITTQSDNNPEVLLGRVEAVCVSQ
jgi:biopolymer transport protein ExbD